MPPRIRSFFARPPFARERKAPAAKEAPKVFREFVETLQRLDRRAAAGTGAATLNGRAAAGAGAATLNGRAAAGAGAATSGNRAAGAPARKRGYGAASSRRRHSGNGHADPRTQRGRRRPR
jgi:hypothetical protein